MIAFYDIPGIAKLYHDRSTCEPIRYREIKLESGLRLLARDDGYFVLDFKKAPFGQPHQCAEISSYHFSDISTLNMRMETIHAFLACIKTQQKKIKHIQNITDKEPLCNYIECSADCYDLDTILAKADVNQFSSYTYMIAVKDVVARNKENIRLLDVELLNSSVKLLDKIAMKGSMQCYVLGVLYRSICYLRSGRYIDSVIYARAAFEWLAKAAYPNENNPYSCLIKKHKINCEEEKIITSLTALRGSSVHELTFPKNPEIISEGLVMILKIYNLEVGVEICLPISTAGFTIYETIS